MQQLLARLVRKKFVRNVATVASGAALSQIIALALAPIITRLYDPNVIGILGTFMTVVAILAPLASLTYPVAIILPKHDGQAVGLVRLAALIAVATALATSLILLLWGHDVVSLLGAESLSSFLAFLPLAMLLMAGVQIAEQWLIRKHRYKATAKALIAKALVLNGSKVGAGLFAPTALALIVLTILGTAFHVLILVKYAFQGKTLTQEAADGGEERRSLKHLARQYGDFPMYRTPQVFLNALSQGLPVLMLASLFGPAAAGFYTLAKQALGAPAQLLSKSIGDVFYPRISAAEKNGENLAKLLIQATLALMALGIVPFGLVMLAGPWLFGLVFGDEWSVAGEYARWLSLWLLFALVNRPAVSALPVLKLQGLFLVYEVVSVVVRFGALGAGFYLLADDIAAVALFSLAGTVLNAALILFTILYAKRLDYDTFHGKEPA
ncbi:lipopolysaccharide biosynthesis protein [Halomonas shantousis]